MRFARNTASCGRFLAAFADGLKRKSPDPPSRNLRGPANPESHSGELGFLYYPGRGGGLW